ncbi:Interferon-inducible GTPase 1 [Fusarium oxysporum f. sp. raphani]|uniref:Interferon-inducible GTPase 1 n=1 Tax=Fusarium oxysporum f. sp. raphani TaxID=96318 RepID=A0A8J5NDX3_FUSOX|nr:Interferon-inducible GTPase 1 [Fusarium oxysporum f. sp. raphani]
MDNGPSFKQWVAMSAAYSVGKSVLDSWNSSSQARERRRRREAEERERREREAREAAEERERRERERREALERLMQDLGIDIDNPVITEEDISEARKDIGYEPNTCNIVFAGKLNAGKSSIINAIRDRTSQDNDYAPTGASEVTLERHQYPDPIHAGFVWYDTRGSGTESVTAYDHYYSQQLYAYDLVVLVHDSTLTQSDIRILQVCHLMGQRWLAVRTKCDMHIRNYQIERDWDAETAKAAFLTEVEDDVSHFTQQAEASEIGFAAQFRDFVVSAPGIRRVIRGQPSGSDATNAFIDEVGFLQALGLTYGGADNAL